jgi:transglutaminase-like putative cysteine protease
MSTSLRSDTQLRLVAVFAFVLAPHAAHLPVWCSMSVAALAVWRVFAVKRHWPSPPRVLRAALTLITFMCVYVSFGRVNGQTAGVALLVLMAGLKLTELGERRDAMFLTFLLYFILITHFLFSQDLWTIAYLLVGVLLITALLADMSHDGAALPLYTSLRVSGVMIAQALPLMVVMFVLFPRLPGPLWGLPSDNGAARSGLSDTMSPGDIAHLIQSDATAFRVRFIDPPPPPYQRYWRGPVLDTFDGRRWTVSPQSSSDTPAAVRLEGASIRYEVILEPTDQAWLFGLDAVDRGTLPPDAHTDAALLIRAHDPVQARRLYTLTSYPNYLLAPALSRNEQAHELRLPLFGNPRTRELAQSWRAEGLNDEGIVQRALWMYGHENFVYTLEPPRLGREAVDEFLFETRRGFCEHYASSFTVLMRAAGIPARVVTGYQGGEKNAVGDYYIVRQSDAHAWSEVWLKNRGWVRIDPTAAVAPNRIEAGVASALRDTGTLPAFLSPERRGSFRFALRARLDWVNQQWSRWVLAYGPELQHDVLSHLGLNGWEDLMLAMTASLSVLLGIAGLIVMQSSFPAEPKDAALREWKRALRRVARHGLVQRPDEGPRDFATRVAAARPELAGPFCLVLDLYLRSRYLDTPDASMQKALGTAVSQLR